MAPTPAQARESGKRGGRPKGSGGALAKISEHKARELAHKNETPLDVMIDNMNFWRKRASELSEAMQQQLAVIAQLNVKDKNQQAAFIEGMREFNKIALHMIAAREKAQGCAVDAAPYVHPRFASIQVKQQTTDVLIEMVITSPGGGEITFDGQPETGHTRAEPAVIDAEPVDDGFSVELPGTEEEN